MLIQFTYCQVPVQGVAHGQCEVLRQQEGPGQAAALRRGGGRPAADGRGLHIQVGPQIRECIGFKIWGH